MEHTKMVYKDYICFQVKNPPISWRTISLVTSSQLCGELEVLLEEKSMISVYQKSVGQ